VKKTRKKGGRELVSHWWRLVTVAVVVVAVSYVCQRCVEGSDGSVAGVVVAGAYEDDDESEEEEAAAEEGPLMGRSGKTAMEKGKQQSHDVVVR
jgi:hypothetical protein